MASTTPQRSKLEAEEDTKTPMTDCPDITFTKKTGNHDLRIIGLGFQRCGSYSLKFALDILGFKTFHPIHMLDVMVQKKSTAVTMNKEWEWWYNLDSRVETQKQLCKDNGVDTSTIKIDFDSYFDSLKPYYPEKEYDSVLDWPFCFYYKELCDYYPNAKCILVMRSNKEKWYNSYMDLYKIFLKRNIFKLFGSIYERALWLDEFGIKCLNCFGIKNYEQLINNRNECKKILIKNYDDRTNDIINYFEKRGEKNRLLILNFIDGDCKTDKQKWDILCNFFNVPLPKDPKTGELLAFPHKNQKKFLQSAFTSLAWLAITPILVASVVIVIIAIIFHYYT